MTSFTRDLLDKAEQNAKLWLQPEFDDQTRKEVQKMLNSQSSELIDNFAVPMEFGTAGLRGIMGVGLSKMNIYTVKGAALGIARYLRTANSKPVIALAYDGRKNSKEFAQVAAGVLLHEGITVHFFTEIQPTPLLAFTVRNLKLDFGIMITSSHNPPEYNGLKAYVNYGGQIISPMDTEISKQISNIPNLAAIPMVNWENHSSLIKCGEKEVKTYSQWVNKLLEKKEHFADLKFVYTPLAGSAGKLAQKVLQDCGFSGMQIVPEQQNPDSSFAGLKAPNPELPENFELALRLAKKSNADLVIANDGDGDRLGVYLRETSGEFVFLSGNRLGCLLAWVLLVKLKLQNKIHGNELIVSTVVSTPQIRAIGEYFGIRFQETLTGFKWMGAAAEKSENFIFAFEEAFGYCVYGRDKDGISAAAILCAAASEWKEQGGLTALIEQMEREVGYFEEDAFEKSFPGNEGQQQMNGILSRLRSHIPKELANVKIKEIRDVLQGERVSASGRVIDDSLPKQNLIIYRAEDESWMAIRPSGTEPKIKAYFGVKMAYSSKDLADSRLYALRQQAALWFTANE